MSGTYTLRTIARGKSPPEFPGFHVAHLVTRKLLTLSNFRFMLDHIPRGVLTMRLALLLRKGFRTACILAASVLLSAGSLLGRAVRPSRRTSVGIARRITAVQEAMKKTVEASPGASPLGQWGNWGNWINWNNWANWSNWANWNNWNNWGNWRNW
jgi:hypothetical protein